MPNPADDRWMPLEEFVDDGWVQEINRLLLHPAGLALAYDRDDEGRVTSLIGVWDYRDDPEGIVFGQAWHDDPHTGERADTVAHAVARLRDARVARFGWDVQPLPGEPLD